MTKLMYGSGLRVMERIRLRVKDIDFEMSQIMVRDGKGKKDRITVLPEDIKPALKEHLVYVKRLHQSDLGAGCGRVFSAERACSKISKRRQTLGMAICVSCQDSIKGSKIRNKRKASLTCQQHPESDPKIS